MSNRLLLRPMEAAERLAVGRSKLYELIAAGEVPSVKIGRSLRVPAAELKQWVPSAPPQRPLMRRRGCRPRRWRGGASDW